MCLAGVIYASSTPRDLREFAAAWHHVNCNEKETLSLFCLSFSSRSFFLLVTWAVAAWIRQRSYNPALRVIFSRFFSLFYSSSRCVSGRVLRVYAAAWHDEYCINKATLSFYFVLGRVLRELAAAWHNDCVLNMPTLSLFCMFVF